MRKLHLHWRLANQTRACSSKRTAAIFKLTPCAAGATAGNTTADDDSFWSSTGRLSQEGVVSLTYRLADPLCVLRAVSVAVYRARYQFGCAALT